MRYLTGQNGRSNSMREIQAIEAKTHLAQLLSAVERGESFAITRHGRPIAHLVPAIAAECSAARHHGHRA
jgi:prevent-host-death family protein